LTASIEIPNRMKTNQNAFKLKREGNASENNTEKFYSITNNKPI
jgi:hypothetical protein